MAWHSITSHHSSILLMLAPSRASRQIFRGVLSPAGPAESIWKTISMGGGHDSSSPSTPTRSVICHVIRSPLMRLLGPRFTWPMCRSKVCWGWPTSPKKTPLDRSFPQAARSLLFSFSRVDATAGLSGSMGHRWANTSLRPQIRHRCRTQQSVNTLVARTSTVNARKTACGPELIGRANRTPIWRILLIWAACHACQRLLARVSANIKRIRRRLPCSGDPLRSQITACRLLNAHSPIGRLALRPIHPVLPLHESSWCGFPPASPA